MEGLDETQVDSSTKSPWISAVGLKNRDGPTDHPPRFLVVLRPAVSRNRPTSISFVPSIPNPDYPTP